MNSKTKQDKFIEYIRPLLPRVERYALSLALNRTDARDLVQEAAVAAFEGFGRLRSPEALLSYMFTVVRRKFFKDMAKRRKFDDSDDITLDMFRSQDILPDDRADLRIMMEAISKLGDHNREILIMFEFSGLSIKEIAEITEKSESAVKTVLHRSRKQLAGMLGINHEKITNK
ncbi:MAG: RNA polymerase sigma factor [Candidatus Kapaibacterium sp.]